MPIDPNISLQAGKIGSQGIDLMPGVERGLKLQQLAYQPALLQQQLYTAEQAERTARQAELSSAEAQRLTQAQIKEAETRLPGIAAEVGQKVRKETFVTQWLPQNAARFKDSSGRTDGVRLAEAAIEAGYATEALDLQGSLLNNRQKEIQNATSDAARAQALTKYQVEAQAHISNQLYAARQAGATPDQLQQILAALTDDIDARMPQAGIGSSIVKVLSSVDQKTGVASIDSKKLDAARTAGMTVEQQEAKNLEKQRLALETLKATPEYQAQIAGIPTAQLTSTLFDTASTIESGLATTRSGVRSISELKDLPGRPGAIAADVWNRLVGQSPEHARVQGAIDDYNRRNPPAPGGKPLSIVDGLDAIRAALLQDISNSSARAKTLQSLAGAKDVKNFQPEKPPIVITSPDQIRTLPPGTRVVAPDGSIRVIPERK